MRLNLRPHLAHWYQAVGNMPIDDLVRAFWRGKQRSRADPGKPKLSHPVLGAIKNTARLGGDRNDRLPTQFVGFGTRHRTPRPAPIPPPELAVDLKVRTSSPHVREDRARLFQAVHGTSLVEAGLPSLQYAAVRLSRRVSCLHGGPNGWMRALVVMLDDFFSANAARFGDAVAVVDHCRAYTYSELDRLSNELASGLSAHGIGRRSRVGIALYPDAASLATTLAVLKTGACFVHLDTCLMGATLGDMVVRSGAELVIASEKERERITTDGRSVLTIEELCASDRSASVQRRHATRRPTDHAFISFTTGTSGTRKCVAVSHGSAIYAYRNFWHAAVQAGECSRFAVFSYFDWDALGPLVHGHTCFLPPVEVLAEPGRIAGYIHEARINHCFLTPSLINGMLAEVPPSDLEVLLRSLNVVWTGGEVLTAVTARRLLSLNAALTVINNYGPSECFVVSQGRIDKGCLPDSGICSVGPVLPGTKGVIVGPDSTMLRPGEVGTLCVSGPCLIDGYLDDVGDRNAFFTLEGERYFWTGDAARFGPEGDLYILGRQPRELPPDVYGGTQRSVEAKLMQFTDVVACVHHRHVEGPGDILNLIFVAMADHLPGDPETRLRDYSAAAIREICDVRDGERLEAYEVHQIPLSIGSQKADVRRLLGMRSDAKRLW